MITNILVPLDGSELAERALPYATALARASDGTLMLLQAVDAIGLARRPEDEPDPLTRLQASVATLRAGGVKAEPYLSHRYMEEVGQAIARSARERAADLIVMSTHGRGGLGRWIYGSVADAVLREAAVPVLLIPAACERRWPTDRTPRILVPLDGSDLAATALGPAVELADLLGAELLLLRVIPPAPYLEGYYYVEAEEEQQLAEARSALEALAERLRTDRRNVEVRTVLGYPSSEVASIAREEDLDLIAMATHGRTGLARVVMGSVASGTLQRAERPILLVRPSELRKAAPEPAAPETTTSPGEREPLEPAVSLSLTARELDLLERGLGDLLYLPESDVQLARPTHELLAKLRRAEQELPTAVGQADG
jgi:nucleotide-binding universal stress UspA family protein